GSSGRGPTRSTASRSRWPDLHRHSPRERSTRHGRAWCSSTAPATRACSRGGLVALVQILINGGREGRGPAAERKVLLVKVSPLMTGTVVSAVADVGDTGVVDGGGGVEPLSSTVTDPSYWAM